ncbi:MAG: pyrophosphate synthase [Hyphomicrobiales bacterium]|nr:pyrophosphate synthase [Hyphomicrobiales bacterium]
MQSNLLSKLHVGIIMDGNGRWAQARGLSRGRGHEAGVETVQQVVEAAVDQGIGTLSLYAFSSDNWRRPSAEVALLMRLLSRYLRSEVAKLVENGVRLKVIGRRDRLPGGMAAEITRAETATASGTKLDLRIAIDYSGRDAILQAASRISCPDDLTRDGFARLITGELEARDVDLLIRTSGEQRLSDFMLWECAYAELYFTDCLWPDFGPAQLQAALQEFSRRDRRFGALVASTAA